MFLVHTPYPWMDPEAYSGSYARSISNISGMVAPVFMFLAGVSVAILACSTKGLRSEARFEVALRGIEILVIAYLLQLAFWVFGGFSGSWTRILKVDILNCIGASMVLGAVFAWPGKGFNWRGAVGFLALLFGAQFLWRMPALVALPDGLEGYLVFARKRSQFPLFPYGAWVFLGLTLGPIWYRLSVREGRERLLWTGVAIGALASLLIGLGMKAVHVEIPWSEIGLEDGPIRTTVGHFFFKMGILLMLFVGARLSAPLLDRFPFAVPVVFGRASLFAYCVHLILVYHAFAPFLGKSLGRLGHLAGVLLLAAVMYALSLAWIRWSPGPPFKLIARPRRAR